MAKDSGKSVWENITGTGHDSNKQKKNWDRHSGATRNPGTGKPNTKSSVRERRRKNKGK